MPRAVLHGKNYTLRRRNLASKLADVRGTAGRIRAIVDTVRSGLSNDEDPDILRHAIRDVEVTGSLVTTQCFSPNDCVDDCRRVRSG